jgi:hypothetical protein
MMKRIFLIFTLLAVLLMLPCGALETEDVATSSVPSETLPPAEEVEQESGEKEGMTPEKFKVYMEETIAPYVIIVFTTVAMIYAAIAPVIAKMSKSSDDLKAAKGDIKKANEDSDTAKQESRNLLAELQAERAVQRAEQAAFEQRMEAKMQSMTDTVNGALSVANVQTREIRDMVQIGFCNNKDLVERGVARQIARIAQGKGVGETMPSESEALESGEQDGEEADEHEDQATA